MIILRFQKKDQKRTSEVDNWTCNEDLSVSNPAPTFSPHTMEASLCLFKCWVSSSAFKKAFYCPVWPDRKSNPSAPFQSTLSTTNQFLYCLRGPSPCHGARQHSSFEETFQRWQVVGYTVSDLTCQRFEHQTYRSREERSSNWLVRPLIGSKKGVALLDPT